MMTLPAQVHMALDRLEAAGWEAFVVGGAVRDALRGCAAGDWDITTDAEPEQVERVFAGERLIETGLRHGTVTVLLDGLPLEITTYRVDGGYSDHRRPDSVTFTRSLRADLLRRDFTINALAYHPRAGLVDICGGAEDLARGVVRCVGEPERRFREDGLRILRALRFASVLGFQIAPETAAAIHRCAELLRYLAAERVLSELTKLLCGQNAGAVLREFSDVLAIPIPELRPMFGFAQHNPHHDRDVWQHTIAVVEHIPPEPVLRWAALLHDVGKPPCFSLADDGVGHFYGHAAKSTELADAILMRLRMDTAGRTRITQLIRYHDLPIAPEAKPIRRLMNKLGVETVRQLFELHIADTCGQSAICAGRVQTYQEAGRVLDKLLAADACFSLKDLAVNGDDLLALGLRGGQERGNGALIFKGHRAGMPLLQCGGQIRAGQGSRAALRLEPDADPVRLSVFLTECPPQLKIDRLPGNDAAQCAADGRAGAGEHRVLLDGLPQELGKENRERPVGIPQRAERLEHRQAAEVFLLIEHIDRQRPRALQLQ